MFEAVNKRLKTDFDLSALNEIIVRSEKHGAFYHPASIEVLTTNKRVKFGLNIAVSGTGRNALKKEYDVLGMLHEQYKLPYLPQPFLMDEMHSMVFLLEEWFEGYHEFSSLIDPRWRSTGKTLGIRQRRAISHRCTELEIYRQAARILTLFYNLKDFRLIYPWHHAAGDFIVKIADKDHIDVRLTTVRGYESFMGRDKDDAVNPSVALFYFLLHLSVQMRLDRLDGVGDSVWADDFCVDATLKGFFQGLELKQDFSDIVVHRQRFFEITEILQQR